MKKRWNITTYDHGEAVEVAQGVSHEDALTAIRYAVEGRTPDRGEDVAELSELRRPDYAPLAHAA